MNLLAIESATNLVGAAVAAGGHTAERSHQGGRRHAELLIPSIEEACGLAGVKVNDIDAVAVDVGPGLFTGLRVGVATAKALAQALGADLLGISSLDVLAAGVSALAPTQSSLTVVSVVDARRGELFVAVYQFDRSALGTSEGVEPNDWRLMETEVLTPDGLLDVLARLTLAVGDRAAVVGDGAVRYLDRISAMDRIDVSFAERISSPSPATLAHLAVRRFGHGWAPVAPWQLLPDYHRQADARINWEQRTPPAASSSS